MNDTKFAQQVQRLVDQQLKSAELSELMRYAELDPRRYRDIALAFVESQMLDEQLQRLTPWLGKTAAPNSAETTPNQRAALPNQRAASPGHESTEASSRLASGEEPRKPALNGTSHPSVGRKAEREASGLAMTAGGKTFWIALAASLALAIPASLTGYWLGDTHRTNLNRDRIANVDGEATPDRLGNASPGQPTGRDLRTSDPSTGQAAHERGSNDRGAADSSANDMRQNQTETGPATISPAVPELVRMQLLRSGFVLGEETQVVKVELDEGRVVDVPVTQLKVNYLGNRIYQ